MSKQHKPKKVKSKRKKKHRFCAGPGCRNVVAKDSKKGALCSLCQEKLGVEILKEPKPEKKPAPEKKVIAARVADAPTTADRLRSLREKLGTKE